LTSKIDEVLEFLALDSDLHSVEEVSERSSIPRNLCQDIASFLAKYGFIQFRGSKMRINPKMKDFIIATSDEETVLRITASIVASSSIEKR